MINKEQQAVVDYIRDGGSCFVTGGPGTGKTEIFNAIAEGLDGSAAFLPFTRAARGELESRLPMMEFILRDEVLRTRTPVGEIRIATIHSFCQSYLDFYPGSPSKQLEEFLKLKVKPKFNLVGTDEGQDLSGAQFEVTRSIIGKQYFLAGDPNQTIFTFDEAIGSDIFTYLEHEGCRSFELQENYRSGPEIVRLLNYLLSNGLIANGPRTKEIISKGPKTYGTTAVLARYHPDLTKVEDKLKEAGIPYRRRNKTKADTVFKGGGNLHLMVGHACKGLGFDRVYQIDWPLFTYSSDIANPFHERQLNAEFNLIYVAISRATTEFYLVDSGEDTAGRMLLEDTEYNDISTKELVDKLMLDSLVEVL